MAKKRASSAASKTPAAPRGPRQVLMLVGGPWHDGQKMGEAFRTHLDQSGRWRWKSPATSTPWPRCSNT